MQVWFPTDLPLLQMDPGAAEDQLLPPNMPDISPQQAGAARGVSPRIYSDGRNGWKDA
jgi:hypothetical protein